MFQMQSELRSTNLHAATSRHRHRPSKTSRPTSSQAPTSTQKANTSRGRTVADGDKPAHNHKQAHHKRHEQMETNQLTITKKQKQGQNKRHEGRAHAYCSRWRMRRPAAGECTCCEIMAGLASQGRGLYPSSMPTSSCSLYLGWNRASLHPTIHSFIHCIYTYRSLHLHILLRPTEAI